MTMTTSRGLARLTRDVAKVAHEDGSGVRRVSGIPGDAIKYCRIDLKTGAVFKLDLSGLLG